MLQTLEIIGSVLFLVQTAIPALQYLAKLTATHVDDDAVARVGAIVHDLLAYLPATRLGATIEEKVLLKDAKASIDSPGPM
jgi:hypothetical protein